MKQDIKVILFDLDGTLLNSRDFLVQASYDILQKYYPNEFAYEIIEADFGNGFSRLLPEKKSVKSLQALSDFQLVKVNKYHETEYFPDVIKGLEQLSNNNIRLGIVTNQNRQVAMNSLQHYKIEKLFDVIITHQDVKSAKPAPEGIFKAMEKLLCEKHEVIMIGDSRFDLMAGDNAGVKTGFITWYDNLLIPKETPPDFVFENFKMILEFVLRNHDIQRRGS